MTDKLAVRAQAAYLHEDGFVQRGTQDLGGNISRLGRLQVAYDFTDNVKLTLAGFYSDSHGTGSPQDIISFDLQPNLNYQGNYADWLRDALVLAGQPTLGLLNDPRVVLDDYTMPDFCFLDDFNPDWDQACALQGRQHLQAGRRQPAVEDQRRPAVHLHHRLLAPRPQVAERHGRCWASP